MKMMEGLCEGGGGGKVLCSGGMGGVKVMVPGGDGYIRSSNKDCFNPQVLMGYRLERPKMCPQEVYQLMMKCWQAVNMALFS